MIGKLVKGASIRGLMSYLMSETDSAHNQRAYNAVIGGTIIGENIDDIVRQYARFRAMKPDLKNAVVHESIRLPEGEELSAEKWREIGDEWARRMGFQLYTIVQHERDHAHIAALRIGLDGKTITDSQDWRRSESVIRQLEQAHGLQQVADSHLLDESRKLTHKKAPTQRQIKMHERTGKVPPSIIVQAAIDEIMAAGPVSASRFVDEMESRGVEVRANVASTGKFNGFSYAVDGTKLTSNTLGKGYTLGSLMAKGLEYEQSRDLERLRSTNLGAEIRADISAEISTNRDRAERTADARTDREIGERHGAAGVEYGQSARAVIGHGAADREDHDAVGQGQGPARKSAGRAEGVGGTAEERPADRQSSSGRFAGRTASVDLDKCSDAVRVVAAYSGAGAGIVESAVKQTLTALPDEAYEIRLLRRDTGAVTTRTWSADQLMTSIPWLRRENARGKEVLFRPTDSRYLLLDDVPPNSLPEMAQAGCAPALVMETSPGKLQAWMRLPQAVQKPVLVEISRQLVDRFGADKGAIGSDRFGKLPGFTNRKPEREYEKGGRILAPFVRLIEASGAVMQAGADLIRYAHQTVRAAVTAQRARQMQAAKAVQAGDLAQAWHQAQTDELQRRRAKGEAVDPSALDFVAVAQMLRAGYAADDLAAHLEQQSQRHKDPADYARRTVERAAESNAQRGPAMGR